MHLSPIGKIVSEYWKQIPDHHTDVTLDEFVVMPNHVHGIITIVGARHASPNSVKPGPKPRSLGSIIGSFKSAVTKKVDEIRNSSGASLWQRNYYEHIIRNERELNLIRQYIISNPLQWELDRENPAVKDKPGRDEIAEILNDDSRRGDARVAPIQKGEACLAPTIDNDEKKKELFTSLIHEVSQVTRPVTSAPAQTDDNPDKALQAVCEILKEKVPHYDWVGFYLTDPNIERQLILGSFAGAPTDHVRIAFGEGICGQAAERKQTFIVPDVSKETNYLSCSPTVKSEIVLPILNEGETLGELDIDSHTIDAFSKEDRAFLLKVCCTVSRLLQRAQETRRK
jgi:putative methionine-R-sulfoxide reductase with GAF domain/REP element-mobilizing transposase RayT